MDILDRIQTAGRLLIRGDSAAIPAPPLPLSPMSTKITRRIDALTAADRADSLLNELTGIGSALDKGTSARPNAAAYRLNEIDLTLLYANNGISRRIIDLVPANQGRRDWSIQDSSDDQDIIGDAMFDLGAKSAIVEGRTWARLYGCAIGLMAMDEEREPGLLRRPMTDAEIMRTPLDLDRVIRVNALHVFDALEAYPVAYQMNPNRPGFRDPEIWQLSPSGPMMISGGLVHHSRLLWFRGQKRPPSLRFSQFGRGVSTNCPDDPLLQSIWDEIRNLTSTMQGGATMAQELRESVLKVAGFKGMMTADQAKDAKARIRLIARSKAILGLILLGEGDEYSSRSNPPSGFGELSAAAQAMLSAVTGIAQTILFGSTPGGLSTDDKSGRESFDRLVDADTELFVRTPYERLADVILHSSDGPTKGDVPEKWKANFGPLSVPTATDQATTRKTVAETDAIYINSGVLDPEQVEASRFGPDGWQPEIIPAEALDIDEDPTEDESVLDDPAGATELLAGLDQPASATALNGAQVASAKGIVADVAAGLLPRDTGLAMLAHFFNLAGDVAEEIMATVGAGFAPETRADSGAPITAIGGDDMHVHGIDLSTEPPTIQPGGTDGHVHTVARGATVTGRTGGHTHQLPSPVVAAMSPTATTKPADAVWLTLELPPKGVVQTQETRGAVEGVLGELDPIEPEGLPHVTVLYVGEVEGDHRRPFLHAAAYIAASHGGLSLYGHGVHTFPASEGRTPIVVGVGGGVEDLEARLLRALAPWIVAHQHDMYRPHVTVGYAPRVLTGAEVAQVEQLSREGLGRTPWCDDEHGTWQPVIVGELVARAGGVVLARMPLGATVRA